MKRCRRRRQGQQRETRDALASNCLLIERGAMGEIALLNYTWQRWKATSKTKKKGRREERKEGRKKAGKRIGRVTVGFEVRH